MDIGERQIRPLWLDEASIYWTTRESWLALLEQVGTDGSPPFYFVIVKAFTVVFGKSEFALRLPSLVATLGLIPALYVLGWRLGGTRTGLLAAALGDCCTSRPLATRQDALTVKAKLRPPVRMVPRFHQGSTR